MPLRKPAAPRADWRAANRETLRLFLRFVPGERQRVFVLTLVIGVACGLAAAAFHLAILQAERLLIDRAINAPGLAAVGWTLLTPTLGGLVCGVLLRYVVPDVRGSGIPQVKVAYAVKGRQMLFRVALGKFVISALQIGSGASLGREGPTVQICAGIASLFGRITALSRRNMLRLLPVGVAAGIAAAFNAPSAAVTFTIEEIVGDLDQTVLSSVIVAAALAAATERSVLGAHPVFDIPSGYGLHHASSLVLYALLGIVVAGMSVLFCDGLLALALIKLAATVFSYSSGGAGGLFAPSLFIGGMLGGAVGFADVALFHHASNEISAFALVGMGAMFAGTIRAPITSVLIIFEMTGGYDLILPLMLAKYDRVCGGDRCRSTKRCLHKLVGLVGKARLRRNVAEGLGERPVGELVDRRTPVFPDQRLVDAVVLMDQWETRQLAVVDRHAPQHLLGILTMSDVVHAEARAARRVNGEEQTFSEVQETMAQ